MHHSVHDTAADKPAALDHDNCMMGIIVYFLSRRDGMASFDLFQNQSATLVVAACTTTTSSKHFVGLMLRTRSLLCFISKIKSKYA